MLNIGRSLSELGGRLSLCSLLAWLRNAGPNTRYFAAKYGEIAAWNTTMRTNYMLADLIDALAQPSGAREYPRPNLSALAERRDDEEQQSYDEWLSNKLEVIQNGKR